MAETARYNLEKQLPELQDLLQKSLFTKSEITDIITKRTKFEYKINKRKARREDFLAYIEFEQSLEQERQRRITESAVKSRHSVSAHSIRQRIGNIYHCAVTKFIGDVELWLQFIDFCIKSDSKKMLTRIFPKYRYVGVRMVANFHRALGVHSNVPTLWIRASKWEWEARGNISAARSLLQKGIRFSPHSGDLWVACFSLELEFAVVIASRRATLGIAMSEDSLHAITQGSLASLVHKHCLKALPGDAELQEKFFQIALEYLDHFPGLLEQLLENIDSSDDASVQALRSKYASTKDYSLCEDLQITLGKFQTEFMTLQDPAVLHRAIQYLGAKASSQGAHEELSILIRDKIDQILQYAMDSSFLTADMCADWISLYIQCGFDTSEIIASALSLYPDSPKIIKQWIAHQLDIETCDVSLILQRLQLADDEALGVALDKVLAIPDTPKFPYLVEEILKVLMGKQNAQLIERTLAAMNKQMGPAKVIAFCRRLASHALQPTALYLGLLNFALTHSDVRMEIVGIFEMTLSNVPSNRAIWLKYLEYLLHNGQVHSVNAVYQRAASVLKDPEFENLYVSLMESL